MSEHEYLSALAVGELRWFEVPDDSDAPAPTKWHAVHETTVHVGSGRIQFAAFCGLTVIAREHGKFVVTIEDLPDGTVPVSPHSEGVCLHCTRALEMARGEQDTASTERMPKPLEDGVE